MRIALVSEHASPLATVGEVDLGGQNVHVAALAAGLIAAGHEVTVFTRRDDRAQSDFTMTPAGYAVVHLDAGESEQLPKDELWPHMPQFASNLRRWFLARRPDVVHAHFWMSAWAAAYALQDSAVPLVLTYHALGAVKRRHQREADTSPAQRVEIERQVGRRADLIVATCTDEMAELDAMGLGSTPTVIVPCGVDVEAFGPYGVTMSPDRPGRSRLVTVGRLVERKGFDALIAALVALPDAELVVAGGPPADRLGADPEYRRLRTLARDRGVADRVRLLGQVPRRLMPALLRSADIVACTPWYEPFGLVPLEAMACARPVVATAVGGLADTVRDGVTGRLVPPHDVDALAEAIGGLLADPRTALAMGRQGRAVVEQRYAWPRVAEATLAAYRSVVDTVADRAVPVA